MSEFALNSAALTPSITGSAISEGLAARARQAAAPSGGRENLRQVVGEFVGNIFYGTMLRQMQSSKFKTKYLNGGRGEEIFQGQLGMELAKRLGRSVSNPAANKLFESIERRLEKDRPSQFAVGGVQ